MKTYLRFLFIQLFGLIERLFTPNAVILANYGPGTHEHGIVTKLADAATTARFLIGKEGATVSDGTYCAVCGSSDVPLYIMHDSAGAAADEVACRILGLGAGTDKAVASGNISFGASLVPYTGGKLRSIPTATGYYYVCGFALQNGVVDGDEFEFAPCKPTYVHVTS